MLLQAKSQLATQNNFYLKHSSNEFMDSLGTSIVNRISRTAINQILQSLSVYYQTKPKQNKPYLPINRGQLLKSYFSTNLSQGYLFSQN